VRKSTVTVQHRILRQLSGDLILLLSPAQMLTHYLSASYGYYIFHESVWDDHDFDELCRRLLAVYDTFEHRHKHLAEKEALEAGTAYHLREEDYPPQIRHSWLSYVHRVNNGEIDYTIRRVHLIGADAYLAEYNLQHQKKDYGKVQR
jgi:hypothetical protein